MRSQLQTFRIGASATFNRQFLLPALSKSSLHKGGARYASEVATNEEIERRLHDLTLDFGIVSHAELSRPLQTRFLEEWKLRLWVPRALRLSQAKAAQAFEQRHLPLRLLSVALFERADRMQVGDWVGSTDLQLNPNSLRGSCRLQEHIGLRSIPQQPNVFLRED